MASVAKQLNTIPLEDRKKDTDELILLGVLSCAIKHNYKLQRMQIMKLLQKIKTAIQINYNLEAYHGEFVKNTHGDFNKEIYHQLTGLIQSDFIKFEGNGPYEKFFPTKKGKSVYEKIQMSKGADNKKLRLIKDIINQIVEKDGGKTSEELREENHSRIFEIDGEKKTMDELETGFVTTPNLEDGENFILDDRLSIDWTLYKKIAARKRSPIEPEESFPNTQEEIYQELGL